MENILDRAQLIAIVDDDTSVRQAVERLLKSLGHAVAGYRSVNDYLCSQNLAKTSVVILDVKMPGLTGLDLQNVITALHAPIPIIFITAHPDEETRERAMRMGAVGILEKPFDDQSLIELLEIALPKTQLTA